MPGRQGGRKELDYRVIRAQEEERKRLARDLHDGLAQALVGVGLSLDMVERHVAADPVSKPEALALLARLRESIAACLGETRRILSDLRPLDLAGRSLSQALKDHVERVSAEAGLKVTVVISGLEVRLHPSLEAGLFRIFQEILNNVREHAQAREVSLKLRFQPRAVAMDVTDDGRGFEFDGDFSRLAGRRCFGLAGIDERVKLLGGTWRVSSQPGQGTEVRVRLPVEARGGFWSFLQGGSGEREEPAGAPGQPAREKGEGRRARPVARVLLADDHRLVREGLKMILDLAQGLEIVGEARDGEEAIRLARDLSPDVVLLDPVMPGPGAAEVTREIRRRCPRAAVVALTAHDDPAQVRELMTAGAAGYLLKTADSDEIVRAIQAATIGLRPLAPEALEALAGTGPAVAAAGEGGAEAAAEAGLTLREREVLALVGEGLTNQEIARKMFISEKTVRNHLGAIIRKLGLSDRTQVALAARGLRVSARGGEE